MKIKVFIILGFLFSLLVMPLQVLAQSPNTISLSQVDPIPTVTDTHAVFTLADVGYRQRDLISPQDLTSVRFNVPPSWRLAAGGEFELNYDVVLSGADANKIIDNKNPFGGNLVLALNGIIIGTVPLDEIGSHTIRVQIPLASLVSKEKDGSHLLVISLNAQFSCLYNVRALITVQPTSFFDLQYETSQLDLNLARLPAPFYVRNSFVPESTLVVVPDNPGALELQAAMDVMAGYGSMVGGLYDIKLVAASQLSTIDLSLYHIIFVGTPAKLARLSDIKFKVPVVNGQFVNLPPESVGDGVVQLANSPWNANRAVMMVSGNSGEAVIKAAQAVSSGGVFVYKDPKIAYVSKVQLLAETISAVEDFSFQGLGYVTKTLSGTGVSSTEYGFSVSKGQAATPDGYIDLNFYHSGLLDYGSSSLSISLNKQMISTIAFNKDSEQATTLRIKFPVGVLQVGENTLTITASMPQFTQSTTNQACDHSGLSNPWVTVSDQTKVHIPVTSIESPAKPAVRDLKLFSQRFTTKNDLGDVAFVVSQSDPVSWTVAGQIAYSLGDTANSLIPDITLTYGDNVAQDIQNTKSIIVIGLASKLPFLTGFNDLLPAPFDFTTNIANERNMQISYRIPAGVGVGYLQLIPSPFNSDKAILVVAGNSDSGLSFAGNGLTVSDLKSQLAGVFAVTNGTQVATGSAAVPAPIDTVIPGSEQITPTPIPDFLSQTPANVRPSWPLPVIVVTSIILLVIIGFVIRRAVVRNRSATNQAPELDHQDTSETDNNPK